MPEGDTIHRAARRVGDALVGAPIVSIETPQPRHARDAIAERLSGRAVKAVDAHGKHLFVRFDGDVTLHSHLRMRGAWHVYRRGERWRRAARRAWLVVRTDAHEVVQFDGPVLELVRDRRVLRRLGPDVLADDFDEARFVELVRVDDPRRALGDALLDQRNVAGIGNIWKSEGCFVARVSPWRALKDLDDAQLLSVVRAARELMTDSVGGSRRRRWVYKRAGLPCRVCDTRIAARGQGDDNRTSYWCPECQR